MALALVSLEIAGDGLLRSSGGLKSLIAAARGLLTQPLAAFVPLVLPALWIGTAQDPAVLVGTARAEALRIGTAGLEAHRADGIAARARRFGILRLEGNWP